MSTPPELTDPTIERRFTRMMLDATDRAREVAAFIASQPPTRACALHPQALCPIDREETQRATFDNRGTLSAGYAPCPECLRERNRVLVRERLHRQGVPAILLDASLRNFRTDDDTREHLDTVVEFCQKRIGFLLLLGDVGTGKSHLAVGAMRKFGDAYFVKQGTLLRMLRDTYRNNKAVDPVELCQNTGLLVLDEIGVSGGGKDEAPMLHEILDHRHGERKPTILTSNLDWQELSQTISPRLAARLKQSAFKVLRFNGPSQRPLAREQYFGNL